MSLSPWLGCVFDGFPLVVYAVSAEEHRSEGMVGIERGAWCLGMKRQKTILIPSVQTILYVLTPVGQTVGHLHNIFNFFCLYAALRRYNKVRLKCISTDTVRAVMRSYVPCGISPLLHQSSYGKFTQTKSIIKSRPRTSNFQPRFSTFRHKLL